MYAQTPATTRPPTDAPAASPASPETSAPVPPAASTGLFFTGTVTSYDNKHITVSRSLLGKPPEKLNCIIDKRTKIARGVRYRARVTVRYEKLAEGVVAFEIQPQPHAVKQ